MTKEIRQELFEIGKIQPNAIELEEAVIGACLLDFEALPIVMEMLTQECFYLDNHKIIFNAIKTLYTEKHPCDILTITTQLKKTHQLEIVGGAYGITQFTNNIASGANVEYHCRIILQQFVKRQIIKTSNSAIRKASDNYFDSFDILDEATGEYKLLYDHLTNGKIVSTQDIFNDTIKDFKDARIHDGIAGYSTGIKDLDATILGLRPGFKYTFAGKPGSGKSSAVKSIAINLIKQSIPGAFFSLEMTSNQLMTHIIAEVCEIDNRLLQTGKYTEQQEAIINEKMKVFPLHLLHIDDQPRITVTQLEAKVKKYVRNFGIKWFVVDYIQMMRVEDNKRKSNEERISEIAYGIKDIAKQEKIVAIDLSQLTKNLDSKESKRPDLSNLKGSGDIEASAETIMLLYRPEQYGFKTVGPYNDSAEGVAEIIVAKNRHGATGSVLCNFTKEYTRFSDRIQTNNSIDYSIPDKDEF